MARLPMHEVLKRELCRQGLPAHSVERLVQELTDHLDELYRNSKEAGKMNTVEDLEKRLGSAQQLATMAAREHRRSYFVGRHPLLCCLVAPIPLVLVCWTLSMLGAIGIAQALSWKLGDRLHVGVAEWPIWVVMLVSSFPYYMRFVPPVLATLLLTWQIRRAGLSLRWTLVSLILVALAAGTLVIQLRLPQSPGTGSLSLNFGIPFGIRGVIQAAVPLATGILFWAWKRPRLAVEMEG